MRAEDLYRLMEEPSELTEGTLLELRRIVEDYPYFQVARMLYLKNLAVLNDMSFTLELEKMAIFLPDRKKLFQLIEGDKYGLNSRVEHEPDMRKEDTFSLIDAFLSNRNEEPEPKKELVPVPAIGIVRLYVLVIIERGRREAIWRGCGE